MFHWETRAPPHPRVSRRGGTLPPKHQDSGTPETVAHPASLPARRPCRGLSPGGIAGCPLPAAGRCGSHTLCFRVLVSCLKENSGKTKSGMETVLPRPRWAESRDMETRTFFRPWPVRVSRSNRSSPHPALGQGGTRGCGSWGRASGAEGAWHAALQLPQGLHATREVVLRGCPLWPPS